MDQLRSSLFVACVTAGDVPARCATTSAALVIIVITAYTLLAVLGVGQAEALADLGAAATLGLKVAASLRTTAAAADV
jgi:hypothetical protein